MLFSSLENHRDYSIDEMVKNIHNLCAYEINEMLYGKMLGWKENILFVRNKVGAFIDDLHKKHPELIRDYKIDVEDNGVNIRNIIAKCNIKGEHRELIFEIIKHREW